VDYFDSNDDSSYAENHLDESQISVAEIRSLDGEKFHELGEALNKILNWCWVGERRPRRGRAAFNRFVAMCAVVRPEIFNNQSYKIIGKSIGVSKPMISVLATKFQREFGVHFRRSHRHTAMGKK